MGLGFPELCIIGLIAIILFGSGKIADLGKGLGQGIRHFKRGIRDDDRSDADLRPALPLATYENDLQQGMTRHVSSHRS